MMVKEEEEMETINWQSLSKKERRRLKKEQKRLEKQREARKAFILKYGLIFGVIIFLIGGFFLFKYLNQKSFENPPQIQVKPQTYDFGKILASEGIAEASFEVKNVGVSPLTISGMETSCECTTAILRVKEQESGRVKESPEFGMHNNSTDWSVSLEPDETAEMVVIYDPNFHKTIGPVTRTVSIFSNDPWKKEEKVTIYADVER